MTAYFDFYSHEKPHPPKCTLFFPFRGPNMGTHHIDTHEERVSPPLSPHEKQVLSHLTQRYYYMLQAIRNNMLIGFNLTAQRIELFSDDLLHSDE